MAVTWFTEREQWLALASLALSTPSDPPDGDVNDSMLTYLFIL